MLAGLNSVHAASAAEDAKLCTVVLDVTAQNRAAVTIEMIGIDAEPDAEGDRVQNHEIEGHLADLFERAGAVVRRETMPDRTVIGSSARVVLERSI